eukprot:scaffold82278_cov48-Attheya_sp.AAC.2
MLLLRLTDNPSQKRDLLHGSVRHKEKIRDTNIYAFAQVGTSTLIQHSTCPSGRRTLRHTTTRVRRAGRDAATGDGRNGRSPAHPQSRVG